MNKDRWFFIFLVALVVVMTIGVTTAHVRRSAKLREMEDRCYKLLCSSPLLNRFGTFELECRSFYQPSPDCDKFFPKEVRSNV